MTVDSDSPESAAGSAAQSPDPAPAASPATSTVQEERLPQNGPEQNPPEQTPQQPETQQPETQLAPIEATPTDTSPTDEKPSERIQIGTQREGVTAEPAQSTSGSSTPPQPSKYPPPNVRDQLSPELEKELEEALAGQSLDDIIEGTASAESATTELAAETKLTCRVVTVHRDDVFVDLGSRTQGLLPLKQFGDKADEGPPEVGTELEVIVTRYNAEQGLYEVSLPTAAVAVGNWDEVEVGQIVEVAITGSNKGGLECQLAGIRGFIPMGQISIYRVEDAAQYVGQRLSCVVTEANRDKRNLVLSHRAMMERERKEQKEKLLAEISKGDVREGVVRSLQDFGAFVDLGGVDGLVHVSQLSWDRIGHPREVLEVGQKIKVRVEKINQENGKIALSYRDPSSNPWKEATTKYPVGNKVTGSVTKLMQFGAFVKLEPGVEGLIHISELGHGHVQSTADVVSEGQNVEVQILSVDTDAQRIGLSLKALLPKPEKPDPKPRKGGPPADSTEQPRRSRKESDKHLKGGIGGPSGGEQFGLKW